MEKLGAIDRWSRFRARWFLPEASGGLVLLALWPAALLFPAAVPLGLGQVLERVEASLVDAAAGHPLSGVGADCGKSSCSLWCPAPNSVCVLLGMLIPCLVGYCIIVARRRRLVFVLLALSAIGIGVGVLGAFGRAELWAVSTPGRG
jgi:hypothetical protein